MFQLTKNAKTAYSCGHVTCTAATDGIMNLIVN